MKYSELDNKIRRNIERDLENTIMLRDNGWFVIRFWEDDIKSDLDYCLEEVKKLIVLRQYEKWSVKNE